MTSRKLVLVISLLCTMAPLLAWESTHRLKRPESVHAVDSNRQLVRSYYANVNAFLMGGEIEPLSSMFESDERGAFLADCGRFERETRWRAMRATYPDLTVRIRESGETGAETVAEIDLETIYTAIPSWLPLTESVMPGHATEWLSIVDGVIVAYRSTLQETLTLELTGHGLNTHAIRDTSLVIARLVFEPDHRTYQHLDGPGMLLILHGELELVPDPAQHVTMAQSSAAEEGESLDRLGVGDAVMSPGGLMVRAAGDGMVTALYVSMQPDGTRANMNQESTKYEGPVLNRTMIGNLGILSALSDVQVTLLDRATIAAASGRGHLRVALVLTREPLLAVESGAVAQIQGPPAATGGCPEERSLYLAAAYQPVT